MEGATVNIPKVTLRNGVEVPQLGFGLYKIAEGADELVKSAIRLGYRHLDNAQVYWNEDQVGRGWRATGIAREELFITSKLGNANHEPEAARESFAKTLEDLQTDYVDLFLIHWPVPMLYGGDVGMPWAVLEEFLAEGRARAIGVSNFEPQHLDKLLQTANVVPMVNQVESHPFFPNLETHEYNAAHGIVTEAWSPLARGRAVTDPTLTQIGEKYGKNAAQVAIRWGLQRGDILFPKASSPERQRENLDVFDFELTDEEMAQILALDEGEAGRSGSNPKTMQRLD